MRTISAQSITDTVAQLCIKANTQLPQDVQAEAFDFPVEFFARRVWRIRRPVHHWTLRSRRFQQIGVPPSAIRLRCHRGAIAERLAYQQKPIERSLDRPHRLDRDRSFPVFHA